MEEETDKITLSNVEKSVLQALIFQGELTSGEIKHILARVVNVERILDTYGREPDSYYLTKERELEQWDKVLEEEDIDDDDMVKPSEVPNEVLKDGMEKISRVMEVYGFNVKSIRNQRSSKGKTSWIFCNALVDAPAKSSKSHTTLEIFVFRLILDEIFDPSGTIEVEESVQESTSNEANNANDSLFYVNAMKNSLKRRQERSILEKRKRNLQNMDEIIFLEYDHYNLKYSARSIHIHHDGHDLKLTASKTDSIINSYISDGWLLSPISGVYTLSQKCIEELKSYLIKTYNTEYTSADGSTKIIERLRHCSRCNEPLTYGQRCGDQECSCFLHLYCAESYFDSKETNPKCPLCNTLWEKHVKVGT